MKAGVDLLALWQSAGVDEPAVTDDPVGRADQLGALLDARDVLDAEATRFAIAADLIGGRYLEANDRMKQLRASERVRLDAFLQPLWGTGLAPRPPIARGGFDLADHFDRIEGLGSHVDSDSDSDEDSGLKWHGGIGGHAYGVEWLMEQIAHAWRAWRVVRASDGVHFGSAVVVHGAWFDPSLAGRSLVMTCAHVCSTLPPTAGAPPKLAPTDAAIEWRTDTRQWAGGRRLAVKRLLWESAEFDAALLEVEELPSEAAAPEAPPTTDLRPRDRIYIWGYPQGRAVAMSGEDNEVRDPDAQYFGYDAFTAPGSSGAPVFASRNHDLVGLHRSENLATHQRQGVVFATILRNAIAALPALLAE